MSLLTYRHLEAATIRIDYKKCKACGLWVKFAKEPHSALKIFGALKIIMRFAYPLLMLQKGGGGKTEFYYQRKRELIDNFPHYP
jgi:hypothetical protein